MILEIVLQIVHPMNFRLQRILFWSLLEPPWVHFQTQKGPPVLMQ